jgi:pyruvate/2-oxoglutarate dehydrogenase complex dihydrolipoamide acyltransferase (E2) component
MVDVRAPCAGVLQGYTVAVGDEVSIGADIAKLDTDATPTATTESKPATVTESQSAAVTESQSAAVTEPHRVPLIRFRHGKANRRAETAPPKPTASTAKAVTLPIDLYGLEYAPSKATQAFEDLPFMYGRPPLTDAEAKAIEMGGV